MAYVVKTKNSYPKSSAEMIKLALTTLEQMGGKQTKKSDPAGGYIDANFNKQIAGKPINNRIQLEAKFKAETPEACVMMVMAYPVDPLGNRLEFGVQGQPAQVALDAFLNGLATYLLPTSWDCS